MIKYLNFKYVFATRELRTPVGTKSVFFYAASSGFYMKTPSGNMTRAFIDDLQKIAALKLQTIPQHSSFTVKNSECTEFET